jgi:hypothetical protein
MIEWVLISNEFNREKIAETERKLSLAGIRTVSEKREFAFRLSERNFDKRGDMKRFNSSVF